MAKIILLFSHKLTDAQIEEVLSTARVCLPEELQKLWSNVNPERELDKVVLNKISNWVKENAAEGDFILIQGEAGLQYYFVDFAFKNGFIPIYATSKRDSVEKIMSDGSVRKVNIFNHVQFRKYKRA